MDFVVADAHLAAPGAEPYVNRLRAQVGMAPAKDVVSEVWLSPYLTLVCGQPADLRAPAGLAGCGAGLRLPRYAEHAAGRPAYRSHRPSSQRAKPPVYMTLGSWMPPDVTTKPTRCAC
jgi:hypothetical protein